MNIRLARGKDSVNPRTKDPLTTLQQNRDCLSVVLERPEPEYIRSQITYRYRRMLQVNTIVIGAHVWRLIARDTLCGCLSA